ncbi:MAG: fibronectin type III domain-containing protein [Deltaproteobacteria bacterium]|nr:fibronectin type III domain-containing protein [Deltaproteobacteria bacterium]
MSTPKAYAVALSLIAAGCGGPPLVVEDAEVRVSLVEPAASGQLPLSASIEVVVAAETTAGQVSTIVLHVAVADCAADRSCERLTLSRDASQFESNRARFCLATHLAAVDLCPGEAERLSVAGLRDGQQLRVWATAVASSQSSHVGRSDERSLTLVDDLPPVVTATGGIGLDDDIYGPGDRISVAIQVVDDQSGVGSVMLHKRGLDGLIDEDEAWDVTPGLTTVVGATTIAVPRDFLCPGTFSIEVDVADAASPPNATTVVLGPGCIGFCSDSTPPGFDNVELSFTGQARTPPYATTGERLTLSFKLDDDLPPGRLPVVDLVLNGQVIATAATSAVVHEPGIPGASYVYVYTVTGDEPPGSYQVRIEAQDTHCNSGLLELPLVLDFTESPTNLRLFNDNRSADSISLDWDMPFTATPPRLHLFFQPYQTTPFESDYVEVPLPAEAPPFVHTGLAAATQHAYRLVAESAVTAGLFTDAVELLPVCTRPAVPSLTVGKRAQNQIEITINGDANPSGSQRSLAYCNVIACGTGSGCVADPDRCTVLGPQTIGTMQVEGLTDDTCYALVLTALGCDSDATPTTVCALTLPKPAAPGWIEVASSTSSSVTFRWQRVEAGEEDPVVGYGLTIMDSGPVGPIPQTAPGVDPTYEVRGLAPGQKVQIAVRAIRTSEAIGDYSPYAIGHALAVVPPAPTGQALSWDRLELALDTGLNGDECDTSYSIVDISTGACVAVDGHEVASAVFAPIGDHCPSPHFSSALVVSGLSPDSDHVFELAARNGDGVGTAAARGSTIVTLARVPPAPQVRSDGSGGLYVLIDSTINPPRTRYAIAIGADRYATLLGQLETMAFFATVQEWQATAGGVNVVGLTPDTLTEVSLFVQNAAGLTSTQPSPAATAWTAPAPPLQLAAVANGAKTVYISYARGANPSRTRFEVQRQNPLVSMLRSELWAEDTGVTPDAVFSYLVRAVGQEYPSPQHSAWVGPVSATTPPAAPAPPLVAATADSSQLQLAPALRDENPATTLLAFVLDGRYVGADGVLGGTTPDPQSFVAKSALTAVTVSGFTPASLHSAKTMALGIDGSLIEGIAVDGHTRPAQPVGLVAATSDPHQIQLSWSANGNPVGTSYRVERSFDGTAYALLTVTTNVYLVDGSSTPLTPGATYHYRVQAQVTGATSDLSASAADTTWPVGPAAPVVGIPASGVADALLISLATDENDASVVYAIRVQLAGVDRWLSQTGALGDTEIWLPRTSWHNILTSGLQPNTQYAVTAFARNNAGDPDQIGSSTLRYTGALVPAAPGVVGSLVRSDTLLITINPATPPNPATTPVAIRVDCGTGPLHVQPDGTLASPQVFRVPADWGATVSAIGILPNRQCAAAVAARNPDNVVSPFSVAASAWTAPNPPAPVNVLAGQVAVDLDWSATQEAASYRVYRSDDCSVFSSPQDIAPPHYRDSSLSADHTYCYRVYGLNGDDPPVLSPQYTQVTAHTLGPQPIKPTDLVVKSGPGAQGATSSDSPVTSLVPTFSATHHDEAVPTDAVQVRLEVEIDDGSSTSVRYSSHSLATPVSNGSRVPDEAMPYIVNPLPFTAGDGFAALGGNGLDRIFVLEGSNSYRFRALHIGRNVWSSLNNAPAPASSGAALAYNSGNNRIYALLPGTSGSQVVIFNPNTNNWGASNPIGCGTVGANAAIATAYVSGAPMHFVYGGSGDELLVFYSSAWHCGVLRLPFGGGPGTSLAVMGTSLFALQGGGQRGFQETSLEGIEVAADLYNAWTALPNARANVNLGGALIAERSNATSLYILTGGATSNVYRYSFPAGQPASGDHTLLATLPEAVGTFGGNRLVYYDTGSRLYAVSGDSENIWYFDSGASLFTGAPRSAADDSAEPLASGTRYRFRFTFADADGWGTTSDWLVFSVTVP